MRFVLLADQGLDRSCMEKDKRILLEVFGLSMVCDGLVGLWILEDIGLDTVWVGNLFRLSSDGKNDLFSGWYRSAWENLLLKPASFGAVCVFDL